MLRARVRMQVDLEARDLDLPSSLIAYIALRII
jgi:hypothetical protein